MDGAHGASTSGADGGWIKILSRQLNIHVHTNTAHISRNGDSDTVGHPIDLSTSTSSTLSPPTTTPSPRVIQNNLHFVAIINYYQYPLATANSHAEYKGICWLYPRRNLWGRGSGRSNILWLEDDDINRRKERDIRRKVSTSSYDTCYSNVWLGLAIEKPYEKLPSLLSTSSSVSIE